MLDCTREASHTLPIYLTSSRSTPATTLTLLCCCPSLLLPHPLSTMFPCPRVHPVLQTSSRSPLLAALHPLALIDLLSFAPSLLGALLPEYTIAPWGWDLRWFRVFRWGEGCFCRVFGSSISLNTKMICF